MILGTEKVINVLVLNEIFLFARVSWNVLTKT